MLWMYLLIAFWLGGVTLSAGMTLPIIALARNQETVQRALHQKNGAWKMALGLLKNVGLWPIQIYDVVKMLVAPTVSQQLAVDIDGTMERGEAAFEAEKLQEFKPQLCAPCLSAFEKWYLENGGASWREVDEETERP